MKVSRWIEDHWEEVLLGILVGSILGFSIAYGITNVLPLIRRILT